MDRQQTTVGTRRQKHTKHYDKRDDHEKILLQHVKGNKCMQGNIVTSKIGPDLGEVQLQTSALELKLSFRF